MDSELPHKEALAEQAAQGRPITQSEASAIAHAESDMTRRGPIKGGAAATAQSLHDRQQNFYGVAGEVARKPAGEVTREDAARVQHFEVCNSRTTRECRADRRDGEQTRVLGHAPGKDSLSAEVQSIADHNAATRHALGKDSPPAEGHNIAHHNAMMRHIDE